ncbi:spondin domain-containing protein [Ningiella sp. W23]|uniref:spondin domain-containing protein n=1 Tax=Ningiella sp. W23 TaxID=3023715 RepID=UPI003756EC03
MRMQTTHLSKIMLVIAGVALISACDDDERIVEVEVPVETIVEVEVPAPIPDPVDFVYSVTVTNLTSSQPVSPVAVVAHESGNLWTVGQAASVALEQLAEGGDNSGVLATGGALASASGAAPIGPGGSETIEITVRDKSDSLLSFATMLVNTNDAFAGLDAFNLGNLSEVGMMHTSVLPALDAGTEVNSEASGTIPGPADGGEGYNPMRLGQSVVSYHPGVVSSDDGLATSVLDASHKFDNPTLRVTVMRLQ